MGSSSSVSGDSAWSKYGLYNVYVGAGTTGLAVGTGFMGRPWINGRLEYNGASFNRDGSSSSIDYGVDLRLQNQAVYLDLRPFSGILRLSLGVSAQQSHLGLTGTTELENTGGEKGNLKARFELPSTMPYAGFGFGLGKNTSGLGMFMDIGAFFGTPKVTQFELTTTSNDPNVQQEARNQSATKKAELEEDIKKLKVYPVVKIGLTYQF